MVIKTPGRPVHCSPWAEDRSFAITFSFFPLFYLLSKYPSSKTHEYWIYHLFPNLELWHPKTTKPCHSQPKPHASYVTYCTSITCIRAVVPLLLLLWKNIVVKAHAFFEATLAGVQRPKHPETGKASFLFVLVT